jgi:hypothetical protein
MEVSNGFQGFFNFQIVDGMGDKPCFVTTWWQVNSTLQELMEKLLNNG